MRFSSSFVTPQTSLQRAARNLFGTGLKTVSSLARGHLNWLQLDRRVLEHDFPKKSGPVVLYFCVR